MPTLKRLLLIIYCITVLVLSVYSQTPAASCLLSNGLCNYNLSDTSTSLPFNTIGKDLGVNYGKYDTSINYPGDITYINEDDGKCTGSSTNCIRTNNGVLHYDVYYPVVAYPSQCPLPCIIYVPGGGYSDCNVLSAAGNDSVAIAYAKRGFICIVVQYRTGRRVAPDQKNYPYVTVQQQLAAYRALQDVTGAIRSII